MFPIWNNGSIVSTLLVITVEDGVYQGSYSEIYAEQLDALKKVALEESPLSLVVKDEHFYAVIANRWYDLNGTAGEYDDQSFVPKFELDVIDAARSLPYTVYPQSRIPTSYTKPFHSNWILSDHTQYCYAGALCALLNSMGYESYTPQGILFAFNNKPGADISEISAYLSKEGFSCNFSESGYMIFSDVQTALYFQESTILIGAHGMNGSLSRHAFILFGYSDDSINQTYRVWNPWYSSSDTQVVDANTRIIPTKDTTSFIWDGGYLYNVHKK